MKTLSVRITGTVQGVGYRAWAEKVARERGISGWIRNRRDGSVEAMVAGPQAAVDAIVAWARRGPDAAVVRSVDTQSAEGRFDAFEQRPTA